MVQSTKTDYDTKYGEIEKKITDHYYRKMFVTTQEFNRLTAEKLKKAKRS